MIEPMYRLNPIQVGLMYSNPRSSTNDVSFIESTYDISNYVAGNSAFQVRFGLGSTDGSITYTGWNIDDVVIEPRGNTGTGTMLTGQAYHSDQMVLEI